MRIHTDTVRIGGLYKALDLVEAQAPDVTLENVSQHASRSHRYAFEVALRGHGERHTKRPNGSSDGYAATYDDWGWFLAALYDVDPSIKAGPYKGRTDFNVKTNNAYML
jgi:hypothetical protein